MRIYLILILFLCSITSFNFTQNRLSVNVGPGYYLLNSENSNKVVGDKRFKWFFHFGFTYGRENLFGHNLLFEYSFHQITKDDAIVFVRTDPSPDPYIGAFGANLTLTNHNFDFDLAGTINNLIAYGAGPSFVITNRLVETNEEAFGEHNLFDKLASSGIGLNTFLNFSIPFSESEHYFFFTSNIKLRYTHSIWFDEGNRKLDDYSQDFITTELLMGIGYSF